MAAKDYLRLTDTPFDEREFSLLWLIALATYGVGDIVTTISIVSFAESVDEGNLLLTTTTALFGYWGIVFPKLIAFFGCLTVCLYGARHGDRFLFYLPPIALSVIGAFATAFNLRLFVG